MGGSYAWSSPAIPRLNGQIDPDHNPLPHNLTPTEESWLASLLPLGATISTIISGYLSDKIGRKYTILSSSLPTIIGFSFLTFGKDITHFLCGRFLCGLGCGPLFTIIPIYVGEVAESGNRGVLGCTMNFFMTLGNLVFLLIPPYINLRVLGAINLVIPIIFALIFGIFVPESPYYYAAKNQMSKAKKSLLKLRCNNSEIVKEELPIIARSVEESFAKKATFKDIYRDKVIMRAFGTALGLVFFQQWSGCNAVFFYMQTIFEEAEVSLSSDFCITIVAIVQFITSAIVLSVADRFGRRVLLLFSTSGHILNLIVIGTYFCLKDYTMVDVVRVNWILIVAINLFIASYSIGMGPITFTMIGELFPPHFKGFAATCSIFLCLFSTFSVTNLFPFLKNFLGTGMTCYLYGIICVFCYIFVYFKVPETRGKSLPEIQKMLLP